MCAVRLFEVQWGVGKQWLYGWVVGTFGRTGDGAPGSSRPTGLGHRIWFVKTDIKVHSVRPSFSSAVGVERAGARCAPLQVYDQHHQKARRPLLHNKQRNNHQVSGASRGEVGRAAAAVCHKAIDGGTLSGHLLLCESYRRRVGCAKVGRAPACRRSAHLGVLRGERIRAVPPCGG